MKTLLILGIGIWGFLALINAYGKPPMEDESSENRPGSMNRFNNADAKKANSPKSVQHQY